MSDIAKLDNFRAKRYRYVIPCLRCVLTIPNETEVQNVLPGLCRERSCNTTIYSISWFMYVYPNMAYRLLISKFIFFLKQYHENVVMSRITKH